MINRIDLVRIKVEWAKKHIRNLERIIESFLQGDPYRIGFKDDVNSGERTFYVDKITDVPWPIVACAGDVIQNLRSSLDHLAHELVCIGMRSRGPFRHCYFPIANTPDEFEADLLRKVKGARQDAMDMIRAVAPYKGGNNVLWALGELNNIDKHRMLLAAAISHSGHCPTPQQREYLTALFLNWFPNARPEFVAGMYFPAETNFPLKKGDPLLTLPISECKENIDFRFQISFDEPQVLQREPLLLTLYQMSDVVDGTIKRFAPLL